MKGLLFKKHSRNLAAYVILTVLILITACSPRLDLSGNAFLPNNWTYADLRALDPADADQPSQDLLALYLDSTSDKLFLRLDLLDIPTQCDYDLFVAIDTYPGGSRKLLGGNNSELEWEVLITLPTSGRFEAIDAHQNPLPESSIVAIRNPELDTVELSIRKAAIPGGSLNPRFEVFSAPAGQTRISDSIAPVSLHDPPPARAPVLLAFWNSMPAYTPVQALRRWSGAHTGPLGGRHGLHYLLKAAQDYQVPLVLLDLKSVPSLPALDYLDVTSPIADMARMGLLTLPEASPLSSLNNPDDLSMWGVERTIYLSRQTSINIGLPASQFLYAASPGWFPNGYRFVFVPAPVTGLHSSIQRYKDYRLLPIPQQDTTLQAGEDGPTLEIRRALVESVLSSSSAPGSILILGGDLAASTWGDPQYASATLNYINAHPWIKLLGAQDLLAIEPGQTQPVKSTTTPPDQTKQAVLEEIFRTEMNASALSRPLIDNAWQAFLALNAPLAPSPPELFTLHQQYLGQVVSLLSAARWADQPTPIADCSQDLDLDGVSECVLASDNVYLLFEKESGSLSYAFARDDQGVHQWIAPTSQFVVGQSDPDTWQMAAGLSADPAVIPGAFYDPQTYTPLVEPGKISFQNPSLEKTYKLLSHGLKIEYSSIPLAAPRLLLSIDPWLRFSPGWGDRYTLETTGEQWNWGATGHFGVQINSSAPLTVQTFNASPHLISQPENPNLDYPPGNLLPFPQALVEFYPSGSFRVTITWPANSVTFP